MDQGVVQLTSSMTRGKVATLEPYPNNAELPVEGSSQNKALHISVKCMDIILLRVIVYVDYSLNLMPNFTLNKLMVEDVQMRANALIVKAFDCSRKAVIGEIGLPILVGPHLFTITFQVMYINHACIYLLERPWIHVTGVVTSILHRKLKFVVGDILVTTFGEEDLLTSHI